jgi:type II secretory pathway component PulF
MEGLMGLSEISDFIKKNGFPMLVAVAMGYFVYHQFNANEEDRHTWTAILIDQLSDLREKSADAIKECKKIP